MTWVTLLLCKGMNGFAAGIVCNVLRKQWYKHTQVSAIQFITIYRATVADIFFKQSDIWTGFWLFLFQVATKQRRVFNVLGLVSAFRKIMCELLEVWRPSKNKRAWHHLGLAVRAGESAFWMPEDKLFWRSQLKGWVGLQVSIKKV